MTLVISWSAPSLAGYLAFISVAPEAVSTYNTLICHLVETSQLIPLYAKFHRHHFLHEYNLQNNVL